MDSTREALLITCASYQDTELRNLRSPMHDAEALTSVLTDPEVGNFNVSVVTDKPHHVVARHMADFFAKRNIDDLLLVYISGHGIKDEDGHLYFAATNTEVASLDATGLPADFVNRQMTKTRSRRVVLLLDCCYAAAFARGMRPRGDEDIHLGEQFQGHGRAVLTASKATEYAFEGDHLVIGKERPSIFTSVLVQGLATGDADRDGDGWISFDDLYDYLSTEVPKHTPHQTPTRWIFDGVGELRIARSRLGRQDPIPTDQAALQTALENIGPMWVRLAMRSTRLIDRQQGLIYDLKRRVADGEVLALVSLLDHLANRMRRNAEDLIVLSGAEPARRWTQPVPLVDVVRAALAEIEDHNRVELLPIHDLGVADHAVADVVHLLAELIENATSFSPPGKKVQVAGQQVRSGYVVEIEDRGLGMSDEELVEANERLAKPSMIASAEKVGLGLRMVSRIAARHRVKVQLRHSWYGGVTALILLPHPLLTSKE